MNANGRPPSRLDWAEWYPILLRLARGVTNAPEDAEDLAHNTCMYMLQNAAVFDPAKGASLPGWLWLLLTQQHARDVRRDVRQKRRHWSISLDEAKQIGVALPSVPPGQEDARYLTEVVAAVDGLTYRQQVALWQHVLSDGMTRAQRQNYYMARYQLRQRLREVADERRRPAPAQRRHLR